MYNIKIFIFVHMLIIHRWLVWDGDGDGVGKVDGAGAPGQVEDHLVIYLHGLDQAGSLVEVHAGTYSAIHGYIHIYTIHTGITQDTVGCTHGIVQHTILHTGGDPDVLVV